MIDGESGEEKKEIAKSPVYGCATTVHNMNGRSKKICERRLSSSHSHGTKPDCCHVVSPFTRQVVHGMKVPSILAKTKSLGASNVAPGKVGLATQPPNALSDMKKMIDKALKARIYFLQQTGPHQFLIGGDSPDHKYRVTIGSQKCSCGKDGICVHILFVMLRVFQVPITDPILSKRFLKNFQVETLLRNFNARRSSKVKSISRSVAVKKDPAKVTNIDVADGNVDAAFSSAASDTKESSENVNNLGTENNDEETCPICLLELVEGESLTECKDGCQNKYHQHCIDIWSSECSRQKEPIVCPLCRAAWKQAGGSPTVGSNNVQDASNSGTSFLDESISGFRSLVSDWTKTFGEHLVQKLTSKNWTDREIGLRRFSEEVGTVILLSIGGGASDGLHDNWMVTFESAISVLSHLLLDPVYKVLVAALRAFRNILFFIPCHNEYQQNNLRFVLKPFIKSLFIKCSDSNRKTCQLALSTLEEFIKGQDGELAIGKDVSNSGSLCLGSLEYLLSLILSNDNTNNASAGDWQLIYGKLTVVQRLVQMFPKSFLISKLSTNCGHDFQSNNDGDASRIDNASCNVNNFHYNKESFLDFSLQYFPHSHVRISKMSRNILLEITRLNAQESDSYYHYILSHVSNSNLIDLSLKETLLSKLLRVEEELNTSDSHQQKHHQSNDNSPVALERRRSVPSIQIEKTLRSKSRPSSSRVSGLTSSSSFNAGHEMRLLESAKCVGLKSLVACPGRDSGNSSMERRHRLKKNLSVSNDSVFIRSIDSGNFHSLTDNTENNRRESMFERSTETHRYDSTAKIVIRSRSENLILSGKCQQPIGRSKCKRTNIKTRYRDAATSMSPQPLEGNFAFPLDGASSSKSKIVNINDLKKNKGHKQLDLKPANRSRQSSAGNTRDFYDLTPSTAEVEKVSFKTEVATTPYSSPQHTLEERCPCKEEVDKEEAEALARALDLSDMQQEALPYVPGLSTPNPRSMSWSLMEELKETKLSWTSFVSNINSSSNHSNSAAAAVATTTATTYEENVHWKRGPIIGSGAACTCYQARDIKTGTLMAVKLISFCRNTVEEQDKVKKLIVDEVHTMAQLNHPNIVRIVGATIQATHVFMFFEWMPGRSIASLVECYGLFSEQVVTKYTLQILRGLIYLHDNHTLHRDLKGANILVDSTGQRLRIGDFGTSARLSATKTLHGEFQGQLIGTVAFMAPEVLKGADYGRSCDIWSLGCCMIEMLTGSPPWVAKHLSNHLALMFKIASADRPPPIPENLNPALKDFLLRCLDINPSDRPTAKELLKHPLFRI